VGEARYGRATFLSIVGLGAVGIVAGDRIRGVFDRPLGAVGDALPTQLAEIVPTGGWRIYAINPPWPSVDRSRLRVEVAGEVERPLTLDWDALTRLPSTSEVRDFHCVTGWSVSDVRWGGVTLAALWDLVKPTAQARFVSFRSLEQPYVDTLTLEQSRMDGVMLAHSMDGAPLSRAHGGPVRVVVPQMYGYKNVKWVGRIELTRTLTPGYWEQNGYDVDAWVGRSNGL
jgi:DMSO/TMAO reductase YedYZ molybdopterin-dependent catalytic subunit